MYGDNVLNAHTIQVQYDTSTIDPSRSESTQFHHQYDACEDACIYAVCHTQEAYQQLPGDHREHRVGYASSAVHQI